MTFGNRSQLVNSLIKQSFINRYKGLSLMKWFVAWACVLPFRKARKNCGRSANFTNLLMRFIPRACAKEQNAPKKSGATLQGWGHIWGHIRKFKFVECLFTGFSVNCLVVLRPPEHQSPDMLRAFFWPRRASSGGISRAAGIENVRPHRLSDTF